MSKRGLTIAGLAVAGGAGYYLYSAGGDPKVAQKKIEADASEVSAKFKTELPGKEKEAEKKGQAYAAQAGQKVDDSVADAKSKLSEAEAKAKQYQKDAGAKLDEFQKDASKKINEGIDKFDATVQKKTSEAKSGISSWFGGK